MVNGGRCTHAFHVGARVLAFLAWARRQISLCFFLSSESWERTAGAAPAVWPVPCARSNGKSSTTHKGARLCAFSTVRAARGGGPARVRSELLVHAPPNMMGARLLFFAVKTLNPSEEPRERAGAKSSVRS